MKKLAKGGETCQVNGILHWKRMLYLTKNSRLHEAAQIRAALDHPSNDIIIDILFQIHGTVLSSS